MAEGRGGYILLLLLALLLLLFPLSHRTQAALRGAHTHQLQRQPRYCHCFLPPRIRHELPGEARRGSGRAAR